MCGVSEVREGEGPEPPPFFPVRRLGEEGQLPLSACSEAAEEQILFSWLQSARKPRPHREWTS